MPLIVTAMALAAQAALPARVDGDVVEVSHAVGTVPWDRAAVEHLWNRAGFGIAEDDIAAWVDAGPHALVDFLLTETGDVDVFEPGRPPHDTVAIAKLKGQARQNAKRDVRLWARQGVDRLRAWWAVELMDGRDPLRDRMTLFWQGVLTSGDDTVRDVRLLATQHALLRRNATGSYAELLSGILRDPAMLTYLNNDDNRKGRPNENLAREVMELFSLGIGNYSERDVKEAARALTGHTVAGGGYRFLKGRHDYGSKKILGEEGRLGVDDLVRLLLAQPACAEFIAGSIIEYLEGLQPEPARAERYAQLLRESNYELEPLLRELFLDPDFYRPAVRQARVTSPLDYIVGIVERLGLTGDSAPPPEFVHSAASLLGQTIFRPPNVKGWDEGIAWISTASFMQRGSVSGALLGTFDASSVGAERERLASDLIEASGDDELSEKEAMRTANRQIGRDELLRAIRVLGRTRWEPRIALHETLAARGPEDDDDLARDLLDLLLAIEAPGETRRLVATELRAARTAEGWSVEDLLRPAAEPELRRIAHLILSLPEAQLH